MAAASARLAARMMRSFGNYIESDDDRKARILDLFIMRHKYTNGIATCSLACHQYERNQSILDLALYPVNIFSLLELVENNKHEIQHQGLSSLGFFYFTNF